jgi:pSer/pThr/pTyr-binding forkhead associated (FHA) protein
MPTVLAHPTDAPTLVADHLPHTSDRDRRRAFTVPRLTSGRYLAVEDGAELVIIELGAAPIRLGRSPGADVMLEHLSVSRRHAVVATRGEVVVVLDDRSLNGVFLNGERVDWHELDNGDEIAIGAFRLYFMQVRDRAASSASSLKLAPGV